MKDNKTFIFELLTLAFLGVLAGGVLGVLEEKGIIKALSFIVVFIALIISVGLHIVIHETGHLIAGLLSGYRFASIRFGKYMWVAGNGQMKLKKYAIPGTSGQCLMIPPENKGYHYPMIFYNLGGSIMNLLVSDIVLVFAVIFHSYVLLIFSFVGTFLAVMNGVPANIGGISNDGMNAFEMKKDEVARIAADLQWKVNSALLYDVRVRDMPQEWFRMPDKYNFKTPSMGIILYIHAMRTLDQGDYVETENEVAWTLENAKGLMSVHRNELRCELMFCRIAMGEYETAQKMYEKDDELKKYIHATMMMPARRRLMYAYYKLVEKDYDSAKKELQAFRKIKKAYPYRGEVISEEEMIQYIASVK